MSPSVEFLSELKGLAARGVIEAVRQDIARNGTAGPSALWALAVSYAARAEPLLFCWEPGQTVPPYELVPVPSWALKAFLEAFAKYCQSEVATLGEAFDSPGKSLPRVRWVQGRGADVARVRELCKTGMSIKRACEAVAQELIAQGLPGYAPTIRAAYYKERSGNAPGERYSKRRK